MTLPLPPLVSFEYTSKVSTAIRSRVKPHVAPLSEKQTSLHIKFSAGQLQESGSPRASHTCFCLSTIPIPYLFIRIPTSPLQSSCCATKNPRVKHEARGAKVRTSFAMMTGEPAVDLTSFVQSETKLSLEKPDRHQAIECLNHSVHSF